MFAFRNTFRNTSLGGGGVFPSEDDGIHPHEIQRRIKWEINFPTIQSLKDQRLSYLPLPITLTCLLISEWSEHHVSSRALSIGPRHSAVGIANGYGLDD
jgi:hypothetical protein